MSKAFDSGIAPNLLEWQQEGCQMELGKQIKGYRTELGLSQEELAEKVYVTRQSISNWENDRTYPDVRSLALLSTVFGISLDTLVKGDLDQMREQIKSEDIRKFEKDSRIFAILMAGMIITPIPLLRFLDGAGIILWVLWSVVTFWYAFRVEKQKKIHDIQTYKEIVAFSEGKRLDELTRHEEMGKRPYQKIALAMTTAVITLVVCGLLAWILA